MFYHGSVIKTWVCNPFCTLLGLSVIGKEISHCTLWTLGKGYLYLDRGQRIFVPR